MKIQLKSENPKTKKVIQFFQNLGCKFIQLNYPSTSTNFLFKYENFIFFIDIPQKKSLLKNQKNSKFKSDENTVLQFLTNKYKSKTI